MPADRSALHAFLTGSPTLGAYPGTQWSKWDALRRQLTSGQFGFELWRGGAGATVADYSFVVK